MKRYARMIYMLSQCKDAIDNPAALFGTNYAARIAQVEKSELWRIFVALTNQELVLAVTSLRVEAESKKKKETTMEDKIIVVVCNYPELYIHL